MGHDILTAAGFGKWAPIYDEQKRADLIAGLEERERAPDWSGDLPDARVSELRREIRRYFDDSHLQYLMGQSFVVVPHESGDLAIWRFHQVARQVGGDWSQLPDLIRRHFDLCITGARDHFDRGEGAPGEEFAAVRQDLRLRVLPDSAREADLCVSAPITQGLCQVLCVDSAGAVEYVQHGAAELWGQPEDRLFEVALRNVAGEPLEQERVELAPGIAAAVFTGDSYYVNSHLLRLHELMDVPAGGCVVSIFQRHAMVVHPVLDSTVVGAVSVMYAMAHDLIGTAEGPVTADLFWYRPGDIRLLRFASDPPRLQPDDDFVNALREVGAI